MKLLFFFDIPVWLPWGVETLVNTLLIGAAAAVGFLILHQDKLIYPSSLPPGSRSDIFTPDRFQMHDWENVAIRTKDKIKITGYAIKCRPYLERISNQSDNPSASLRLRKPDGSKHDVSPYTLLYLHANAGNMGHRLPIAKVFHERAKMNVFMLSYRGYGLSEGNANEQGLKIDSQAALDWIFEHEELKSTKVILYGQSIGGAVAIDLASRNPDRILAVIVENTFLSLPKLVPSVLPYFKYLTFLCHQIWDSETAIKAIPENVPILLLSGGHDELIPQAHMIQLAKIIRSERSLKKQNDEISSAGNDEKLVRDKANVRWVEFPAGLHNDTCMQPGYFEEVLTFLKELFSSQKEKN